jgi:hypothetical protein
MAKKSKGPASTQEFVIHNLSQHALGRPALFYPDEYKNSQEPCDIAWVENRCAILMYMTETRQSHDKMISHNLGQMNRWLKAWKNGQHLSGLVSSKACSFTFADVDHIVGLSVVDGENAQCEYHAERVLFRPEDKLSICATVTGRVIRKFASLGYGPRDIIYWLDFIRCSSSGPFPDDLLLQQIDTVHSALATAVVASFKDARMDLISDAAILRFGEAAMLSMKQNDDDAIRRIAADLLWADVRWITTATIALAKSIAAPGPTETRRYTGLIFWSPRGRIS